MTGIKFNGASFSIASNSIISEREFVDKWSPVVWQSLTPERREETLKEAYGLIKSKVEKPEESLPEKEEDKSESTNSDEQKEAKPSYKPKGRR